MDAENYKILIADDSELSFKIISEILQQISPNVDLFYAEDGKKACEMALEVVPDMILMDVLMPEMNGIEAVRYLREREPTTGTPIIVLSATESLNSAYEAGANDFISKPFQKYELLIKVRSGLNLVQKIKAIKDQRDRITQQRKDILDDIRYSKRIQKAILPTSESMQEALGDYFVLNLPRNIVSGDFYWIGEMNNHQVVAVADCTGHGVSGAFMTMAGTAFLNEILSQQKALHANEILFELRQLVMKLLKQKGEEGEASDGMDISMIMFDKSNGHLQFAGANNPLYLVRNNEIQLIKGDRMPIGIHLNFDKPFENHTLEVQKGDVLYLFTDGYADQFGGPRNKKFRYKQFQDLFVEIHNLPMPEQKEKLHRTIIDWKGDNDQVDDMLILGFRI